MRSFQKYFLAFESVDDKLMSHNIYNKNVVPKFSFYRAVRAIAKYCSY
jgi:hypothetical protein